MEFITILHKAEEGGYWVEVPELPGCFSQGETVEEAIKNITEAIESHIHVLIEEGEKLPSESEVIISKVKIKAA